MAHIKDLLLQLFFALIPFVLYNVYYRDKAVNYSKKFIIVVSSLCLILSMTFPSSIAEGIFFDVRYVIIFFGLVFGGKITGFILLVEFVLYRLYLGGVGTSSAMIILAITFPLALLFNKMYHETKNKLLSTFIAGISFSVIPMLVLYINMSAYVMEYIAFNILLMPVHNSLGIWLLITLFNKSVSDKELYIKHLQTEKIAAINHVAASLAHEVRNPLTAVLGFLKLIRENTISKDKLEQFIDISIDEIQRTELILSEYLSMSKPLTRQRKQLDLVKQIQAVVDVMTPYANMNNVSLEVRTSPEPILIWANPNEMKQLLVNFIKNAIEACFEVAKGKVSVSCRQEFDTVKLDIVDNGIGMTNEQMQRLGSIYYSTKSSGTGLGLTHCYKIIHAMNGVISVRSQLNAGTVFTISIPLFASSE